MPSNVITIVHSPDSDDAFMFYALAKHKINCGGFEFRHVLSDIETLNRQAMEEKYENFSNFFFMPMLFYTISMRYLIVELVWEIAMAL